MNSNTAAAGRVTATIGVVKWIVVGAYVLTAVILMLSINAQEDLPAVYALLVPIGCLLWALVVWVLFGWFQHTLGMLAAIAANTSAPSPVMEYKAGAGDGFVLPGR